MRTFNYHITKYIIIHKTTYNLKKNDILIKLFKEMDIVK
jgi:hypothetical protein